MNFAQRVATIHDCERMSSSWLIKWGRLGRSPKLSQRHWFILRGLLAWNRGLLQRGEWEHLLKAIRQDWFMTSQSHLASQWLVWILKNHSLIRKLAHCYNLWLVRGSQSHCKSNVGSSRNTLSCCERFSTIITRTSSMSFNKSLEIK